MLSLHTKLWGQHTINSFWKLISQWAGEMFDLMHLKVKWTHCYLIRSQRKRPSFDSMLQRWTWVPWYWRKCYSFGRWNCRNEPFDGVKLFNSITFFQYIHRQNINTSKGIDFAHDAIPVYSIGNIYKYLV